MAPLSVVKNSVKFLIQGVSRFVFDVSYSNVPEIEHYCVVFVVGVIEGQSKRYRVYNICEYLSQHGISSKIINLSDIFKFMNDGILCNSVVFFRCPLDSDLGTDVFFEYCKKNRFETIFDIDDLVFDVDILDDIDGYKYLNNADRDLYVDGVKKYRAMMEICDRVTVPTYYLKQKVELLGISADVIPNGINDEQVRISKKIIKEKFDSKNILIGYFSGSNTHQKDFLEVNNSLLKLMRERQDWAFVLVGCLELSEDWLPYSERVYRYPVLSPSEMLNVLSRCRVNLAPLDFRSVFCCAKSELKFFEAALVRVPTVASPTPPFEGAIADAETGFLARDSEEWYKKISLLLNDERLGRRIGLRAQASALSNFGTEKVSELAASSYLTHWHARGLTTLPCRHVHVLVVGRPWADARNIRNWYGILEDMLTLRCHVVVSSLKNKFLYTKIMRMIRRKNLINVNFPFKVLKGKNNLNFNIYAVWNEGGDLRFKSISNDIVRRSIDVYSNKITGVLNENANEILSEVIYCIENE